MEDFNPYNYTFHCECKIYDKDEQESKILYTLNTNIGIGDINFFTKIYLLRKYKKIISSKIKDDNNVKKYEILRCKFVMDLR